VILKATRVDGVYDADPEQIPTRIFCRDFLPRGVEPEPESDGRDGDSLCMDNGMPIVVSI